MKKLFAACLAGVLSTSALSQELPPESFDPSLIEEAAGPGAMYISVNRTGTLNSATVGTGFELAGQGLFVEGTADEAEDFSARVYANFEVFNLALQPGVRYSWGASGGDLIGLGDDNEWGPVTAEVEAVYTVGIIGDEYVFVGTSAEIDEGFVWSGGDYGVGYLFETDSGVYLDARMVWGFDDQYEFSEDSALSLTLGLKF